MGYRDPLRHGVHWGARGPWAACSRGILKRGRDHRRPLVGGGRAADVITVLSAPGSLTAGTDLVRDADESHHLSVRRATEGEQVRVLDGAGASATGTLSLQGKRRRVRIDTVQCIGQPAPTTLAVGAEDRDRCALPVETPVVLGPTLLSPPHPARPLCPCPARPGPPWPGPCAATLGASSFPSLGSPGSLSARNASRAIIPARRRRVISGATLERRSVPQ